MSPREIFKLLSAGRAERERAAVALKGEVERLARAQRVDGDLFDALVQDVVTAIFAACAKGVPPHWTPGGERALIRKSIRNYLANHGRNRGRNESLEFEDEQGDAEVSPRVAEVIAVRDRQTEFDEERRNQAASLFREARDLVHAVVQQMFAEMEADPRRRRNVEGYGQTWEEMLQYYGGRELDEVIRAAGETPDAQARNRRYQNFKRFRAALTSKAEVLPARHHRLVAAFIDQLLTERNQVSDLRSSGFPTEMKPEDSGWQLVGEQALDLPKEGKGLAISAGPDPVGAQWSDVVISGLATSGLKAVARRPGTAVVFVETDIEIQQTHGSASKVATEEGVASTDWRLDARSSEAGLEWRFGGGAFRLRVTDGRVRLEKRGGEGLESWSPPPVAEWPAVDVNRALSDWNSVRPIPWLDAAVRSAARGSSVLRAGALGLLARYANASAEALIDGRSAWDDALDDWSRASGAQRSEVMALAATAAESLAADLDGLSEQVARRDENSRDLVRAWLYQRDDLESIRQVAFRAGADTSSLDRGLAFVDGEASATVEVFHEGRPRGDERLRALSWRDPTLWWGER